VKILVDENIPRMTVAALVSQGHDVRDIRGTSSEGLADLSLWHTAQGEHRLLITTDKGFAAQRQRDHYGVLIVRLRQPNRQSIHDRVLLALARFREERWPGMIVVMRDRAVSVWPRPGD
jgi:predicted nuclease of predicted toxin-antitoxin system